MSHEFWQDQTHWPRDRRTENGSGFVFLASAMNEIARAKYHNAWTGTEPWAPSPLNLPEHQAKASSEERRHAYGLLEKVPVTNPAYEVRARPDVVTGRGRRHPAGPSEILDLTSDEWARALHLSGEIEQAANTAQERWFSLMEMTTQAFLVNRLQCHLRAIEGGAPEPAGRPDDFWFGESFRMRFWKCQVDLDHVHNQRTAVFDPSARAPAQDFRWIYVGEASLTAFIDDLREPMAPRVAASNDKVTAFRDELIQRIRASPKVPSLTRNQALDIATADYGLHPEGFQKAWREATRAVPGHAWSNAGRRPKAGQ